MRTFELVFIVAPNAPEADVERVTELVRTTVTDQGGTIVKLDRLGRRRLAYNIGKYREGDYFLAVVEGSGKEIAEVERRLRVFDIVLRYITVRIDEELKRADKVKQARQARLASRPSRNRQQEAPVAMEAEGAE